MRFRLMTYNIHRAIGLDRQFRPDRIVQIVSHYAADVVLLQEVDEGVPRSQGQDMAYELAEALSYPHYAVGHNVSLRQGRYGNATLSRFPIRRERNIDLSIGTRKRRGCQHTTLDLPGTGLALEVFNLHLGLSARERRAQIQLLLRTGEVSDLGPRTPVVVAGDFNDWRSRLRRPFTEGAGFLCATDRARALRRSIPTYPSFSPSGSLDRIYHRGPLRPLHVRPSSLPIARMASDHLPIIADFEFVAVEERAPA